MTIVINTPNSHIGRRVVTRLLDSEMAVDIITRNPDKVSDLTARGASLIVGSCDDEELLTRSFRRSRSRLLAHAARLSSGLPNVGTRHRVESRRCAS